MDKDKLLFCSKHGPNPSHSTEDCQYLQSLNRGDQVYGQLQPRSEHYRVGNYRTRNYRTENTNRDSYRSQSRSRSRSRDRNFRDRNNGRNSRSPSRSPFRQGPGSSKTEGNGSHYRSFRDFRPPSPHPRLYHTEIRSEDKTPRDADGAPIREDFRIYTTGTGRTKSLQIAQHLNIY